MFSLVLLVFVQRHAREAMIEAGATIDEAVEVVVPPARVHCPRLPDSINLPTLQHALFRELSAIFRSDLTLCVSTFELELLQQAYQVPAHKLALSSFYYEPPSSTADFVPWSHRRNLCMIGQFAVWLVVF